MAKAKTRTVRSFPKGARRVSPGLGRLAWPQVLGHKDWSTLLNGKVVEVDLTDHIRANNLDAGATLRAFRNSARSAAHYREMDFESHKHAEIETVVFIQATVR